MVVYKCKVDGCLSYLIITHPGVMLLFIGGQLTANDVLRSVNNIQFISIVQYFLLLI